MNKPGAVDPRGLLAAEARFGVCRRQQLDDIGSRISHHTPGSRGEGESVPPTYTSPTAASNYYVRPVQHDPRGRLHMAKCANASSEPAIPR